MDKRSSVNPSPVAIFVGLVDIHYKSHAIKKTTLEYTFCCTIPSQNMCKTENMHGHIKKVTKQITTIATIDSISYPSCVSIMTGQLCF